jgi:N-acetylmuramoyl-L-alanine amidase
MDVTCLAISSGHSTKCQGAVGPDPWGLNEVAEATRVVDRVTEYLRSVGVEVAVLHDTTSTSSSQNLERIVSWHAEQACEFNLSIHFNAFGPIEGCRGVEVLWYRNDYEEHARELSAAIAAAAGLPDRGPKYRDDLTFLLEIEHALLAEVCFVDAKGDVEAYERRFEDICMAIASVVCGVGLTAAPPLKPVVTISIDCPDGVDLAVVINGVGVLLPED